MQVITFVGVLIRNDKGIRGEVTTFVSHFTVELSELVKTDNSMSPK